VYKFSTSGIKNAKYGTGLQKKFEGFGKGKTAEKMDGLLAKIDPDYKNNSDIKWNFTKFVVARDGAVVARFEPTAPMSEVAACVARCVER